MQSAISRQLLQTILEQYTLSWNGIHGISHWARVLTNGRRMAYLNGADLEIVELFAIFHDARRETDGVDFTHGRQGAELAASLRGRLIHIDSPRFDQLYYACAYHTDGLTEADITVQTCWDSDRLDLWRVDIEPLAKYLCTSAAINADVFSLSKEESSEHCIPSLVSNEWGIELHNPSAPHPLCPPDPSTTP